MKTIVTLTMNPAIDKSSTVNRVIAERKLRCTRPRYEPGGGGINVSRVIHKLGGESTAIYLAGGMTGQMLRELIDKEGLTHYPVLIKGLSRENLIILEKSTGQQFRFSMPGPTLSDREWQQCLQQLSACDPKPDYIVASGSLPPGVPDDFYARVAHVATDLGAKAIVDTSGKALRLAAGAGVYIIKPNLRELTELMGKEITNESTLEAIAMEIVNSGQSEMVVVSLGAAGVLMASREGCEQLRSPTVPIVSKVGAGDSMVAGIVLSLARGKPLQEAIRFGVAAGAAAVMTPGTELCRREDTERLYQQMTLKK